jgi:hypothetical protein
VRFPIPAPFAVRIPTVPVKILKIGDHASKRRDLWRTIKFHAPLFPFAVFSLDIFRQKYQLSGFAK